MIKLCCSSFIPSLQRHTDGGMMRITRNEQYFKLHAIYVWHCMRDSRTCNEFDVMLAICCS